MKTKLKTRDLTMIAMLGAICCILLLIVRNRDAVKTIYEYEKEAVGLSQNV